jgi:hypothetical protein
MCCKNFFENKSSLELHLIVDHKISLQQMVRSQTLKKTSNRQRSLFKVKKPNDPKKKFIEKIKSLFISESKKLDRDSPPIPNIKLQYCDLNCRRKCKDDNIQGLSTGGDNKVQGLANDIKNSPEHSPVTFEKESYELIEQPKMKIKVI